MKTQIMSALFSLLSFVVLGQTTYSSAFQVGFREGYCYNDFGCISPIPPISSLPYVGESSDNYRDGYNRGFKTGQEYKQRDKLKQSYSYSGNATNNTQSSGLAYKHDFQNDINNLHQQEELIIRYRQQQLLAQQQQQQVNAEKAKVCAGQMKELYSSFAKYPERIQDGWYTVTVTNYYDICGDRKVYVSNNKITKYFIEDYLEKTVNFSSQIENGKAYAKLITDGVISEILDIFFIENIIDPSSTAKKPSVGIYCFYSDFKRGGDIDIFINEKFIGTLRSYFPEGTPSCGQSGTLSFKYKPGTYSYKAKSNNSSWSGTITIDADRCKLLGLTK